VAAVEHPPAHDGRVEELTLARPLPPVQGEQDRNGRLARARLVAHPEPVPHRWVALPAELLLEAAGGLAELIESRPRGPGPIDAPRPGVAVDDLRVEAAGRLVIHAEALGDTGTHVVVDDVDAADQPVGDLPALGRLEVGDDVELAPLAAVERLRHVAHLV